MATRKPVVVEEEALEFGDSIAKVTYKRSVTYDLKDGSRLSQAGESTREVQFTGVWTDQHKSLVVGQVRCDVAALLTAEFDDETMAIGEPSDAPEEKDRGKPQAAATRPPAPVKSGGFKKPAPRTGGGFKGKSAAPRYDDEDLVTIIESICEMMEDGQMQDDVIDGVTRLKFNETYGAILNPQAQWLKSMGISFPKDDRGYPKGVFMNSAPEELQERFQAAYGE